MDRSGCIVQMVLERSEEGYSILRDSREGQESSVSVVLTGIQMQADENVLVGVLVRAL